MTRAIWESYTPERREEIRQKIRAGHAKSTAWTPAKRQQARERALAQHAKANLHLLLLYESQTGV